MITQDQKDLAFVTATFGILTAQGYLLSNINKNKSKSKTRKMVDGLLITGLMYGTMKLTTAIHDKYSNRLEVIE